MDPRPRALTSRSATEPVGLEVNYGLSRCAQHPLACGGPPLVVPRCGGAPDAHEGVPACAPPDKMLNQDGEPIEHERTLRRLVVATARVEMRLR